MHRRHKHDIIVLLSLIGFAISVYLATAHYLGYTPPCTVTKGCEEVLTSKYSQLFGFPLSVWGIAFFCGTIFSSLLANHYQVWRRLLTWLLVVGALLALIFLSIQFFVLKRVCQYCLTTDLLVIILFLWDLNIEHRQ
jgi:uncharacterized membrane protein